jgi:tRNA (guanine37-N1)-methyltransferase
MRFDLVTIFPEFFAGPLDYGIVRRARETGLIDVQVQDLRVFTKDRHRTVDDRPFGGGEGMVLKPEPLFDAVEALLGHSVGAAAGRPAPESKTAVVLLSAAGKLFKQETARRYAGLDRVIFICGRYEGVDERVAEHLATEEVSVGDFVLSGGELPAMLVLDAVTRLLPGALGNEDSALNESFSGGGERQWRDPGTQGQVTSRAQRQRQDLGSKGEPGAPAERQHQAPALGVETVKSGTVGQVPIDSNRVEGMLLDFPHYTRPAEFRGWVVPEVLIGGNHAEVAKWRRAAALEKTRRNRPDLLG